MKRSILHSERGFALIAAILASLILLAVGMLVITLTTGDLRSAVRVVCDKKSLSATETGIQRLMESFNPDNLAASAAANIQADPADATQRYSINAPTLMNLPPLTLAGYAMDAGRGWGMNRYQTQVTGTNTTCNSTVTLNVGIGFGPVPMGTMAQ
jgi:hypothetical protein